MTVLYYFQDVKKLAYTFGLTPAMLWLIGGLSGAYFSGGDAALYIAAALTGGIPLLTTLTAAKFNITGSVFLLIEAFSLPFLVYNEGISIPIIAAVFITYSLPLILSALNFIKYWYKNKTRI